MSETQFLILAVIAFIVTVPIVKGIPRARQSRWFDRVLWMATWLLAFVGAWYAVGQVEMTVPPATLAWDAFVRALGIPIVIGAAGGALALNLVLWLMDRVIPWAVEQSAEEDAERADNITTQSSSEP